MLDFYTKTEIRKQVDNYYKTVKVLNKTIANLKKYIDQAQTLQEKEYWENRLASYSEDHTILYTLWKPLLDYQELLSRS